MTIINIEGVLAAAMLAFIILTVACGLIDERYRRGYTMGFVWGVCAYVCLAALILVPLVGCWRHIPIMAKLIGSVCLAIAWFGYGIRRELRRQPDPGEIRMSGINGD
jgi:hypothetical protein